MFTNKDTEIIDLNYMDYKKDEAWHAILYSESKIKIDEAVKFIITTSSHNRRKKIFDIDIKKLNLVLDKFPSAYPDIINDLITAVGSGTIVVKNIEAASSELQHYFKIVMDRGNADCSANIPQFHGRFVFCGETGNGLDHAFLNRIACAIFLDDTSTASAIEFDQADDLILQALKNKKSIVANV